MLWVLFCTFCFLVNFFVIRVIACAERYFLSFHSILCPMLLYARHIIKSIKHYILFSFLVVHFCTVFVGFLLYSCSALLFTLHAYTMFFT
jgi:hypothetical protein